MAKGILCPKCSSDKSMVVDSRGTADNSIRRRRLCGACGGRFTSYEIVVGEGVEMAAQELKTQADTVEKEMSKLLEHIRRSVRSILPNQ